MTENSSDTPKYLVLPCTGVEKLTGQLTSLVAVNLIQKDPEINILLTPSLPQIAAQLPKEIDNLQKTSIIVLNGCGSQCVTKILTNLNLKAEKTYLITQFLKGKAYHPQSSVQLSPKEVDLVPQIAEELYSDIKNNIFSKKSVSNGILLEFNPEYTDWKEFVYSKFIFKMPVRNRDFYFNGNDVWAYIMGNHVFVGITDYMQKQLSDIITVEFPKIGQQIEQFDGVG